MNIPFDSTEINSRFVAITVKRTIITIGNLATYQFNIVIPNEKSLKNVENVKKILEKSVKNYWKVLKIIEKCWNWWKMLNKSFEKYVKIQ